MANRVSQIPTNRVLVLEGGGDPSPFSNIPAASIFNLTLPIGHAPILSRYKTVKQNNVCLDNAGV